MTHIARLLFLLSGFCIFFGGSQSRASNSPRIRIILDTDANSEVDDQHAIAYLLFSGDVFDVEGITVNRTNSGGSIARHVAEAKRVVRLCGMEERVRVFRGADGSFAEIKAALEEPCFDGIEAVNFIIERARAHDKRPLVILSIGKLTNTALALAKSPEIAPRLRIVWVGSSYPNAREYNQDNDEPAVNYVLNTDAAFEMIPIKGVRPMGTPPIRASLFDIREKMPGKGPKVSPVRGRHGGEYTCFGDYSANLYANIDVPYGTPPGRAFFDVAGVAVVKNPSWSGSYEIPAPIRENGQWQDRPFNRRTIIIRASLHPRAIVTNAVMTDFYDTLAHPQLGR